MMQRTKAALGYVMLLTAVLMLPGCDEETSDTYALKIKDQWFTLETAITKEEQARGLGGREVLAENGGMIFIFDTDERRQFWMKDCLIDIDVLYVDRRGFIDSAYEMKAQPPRAENESPAAYENRLRSAAQYPSRGKARYVIELKAGKIRELGLKRNDKIDLDFDRLKELVDRTDDQ